MLEIRHFSLQEYGGTDALTCLYLGEKGCILQIYVYTTYMHRLALAEIPGAQFPQFQGTVKLKLQGVFTVSFFPLQCVGALCASLGRGQLF